MFTAIRIAHDYATKDNDITMVLTDPENPETSRGFAVTQVTGLGPGKASVTKTEWAILDGADINTIKLPQRTIGIELIFMPTTNEESIEDLRLLSYRLFPIKKQVRFYVYDDEGRTYYIDGVLDKNEPSIWSANEGCSLEIICPDPYFRDFNYVEVSFTELKGIYHFFNTDEPENITTGEVPTEPLDVRKDLTTVVYPLSELLHYQQRWIDNPSNYECGGTFYLSTDGVTVKNPIIYNFTTGESLRLLYTVKPDEVIEISTSPTKNKVESVYNGVRKSIIQYIDLKNSDFIKFYPGLNKIAVNADTHAKFIDLTVRIYPVYVGI